MWLYVTGLLIVVLDQLAKVFVLNRLIPSETLPVIPNILHLTFVRNTGIGGLVPGTAVTQINEDDISSFMPDWVIVSASTVCEHYMIDSRTPNKFKVYPPQPATPSNVEMVYSQVPADITGLGTGGVLNGTEVIALDDQYANALRDYVIFRALSEESTEQDLPKSAAAYKLFTAGLGMGA